ncbi:hypothetical protein pEaSNUABM8_00206 [Erwinia phage pEa_SNUABM_8]|nr:hypothetical protein pEaSNUABM8_00206 [Erwinia phage pEa_SNUABM_8]QVW54958.1 hypothetical protein pEaSNUABM4_00205 [Erwinia phage pEa_SNUABM_4]
MQYQGYVVANDYQNEYPPIVLKRASALELADVMQSHTLIPVTVPIDNPFIDRVDDPFFEPKMLRELGWDDEKIRARLLDNPRMLAQITNTNFWADVVEHIEDVNYTAGDLFERDRDNFMELPVSTELFFSFNENIADAQAQHYDGVVFKGMAACRDSIMVISFRSAAIRYGTEERLPL